MNSIAKKVREIFEDSLYKESETNHDNSIICEGITITVAFHPERLLSHKDEIISLLNNLDDKFKESSGGGYTFLATPFDKNGVQWGGQSNAQELILLGISIGKVKCLIERELWHCLPGGVPYYMILDK